jgi:hypothetical protein
MGGKMFIQKKLQGHPFHLAQQQRNVIYSFISYG